MQHVTNTEKQGNQEKQKNILKYDLSIIQNKKKAPAPGHKIQGPKLRSILLNYFSLFGPLCYFRALHIQGKISAKHPRGFFQCLF